ncbi:MAG: alkaline phosphatase family protein [Capsulimonadales bacterium]|nr:alkaline phosphatase family protein [Capsulimonadales bacterium]
MDFRLTPGNVVRAVLLVAGLTLLSPPGLAQPRPVVVVSWDGAADWIVDRLLAEGKLPNVAALAKRGVRAAYAVPAFPSKTACGHAAIWTGTYGDGNGITGNAVPVLPRNAHSILETTSGFLATSMRAEPLFVTAAKAGKKVVVLSATQSFPPERYAETLAESKVPRERFLTFDGFESPIAPEVVRTGDEFRDAPESPALPPHTGKVKTSSFDIAGTAVTAFVLDDPADPVNGFDTVVLRFPSGGDELRLKPVPASDSLAAYSRRIPITVRDPKRGELFGFTCFRLFELNPADGSMVLFQRGVNGLRGTSTVAERREYLDAYGGFHSVPWDAYDRGRLGKTLWQGGDGEAEKRLLETIRLDCHYLKNGTAFALRTYRPDLLFHYGPMIDSAGHEWMGALDPESPRYEPERAKRLMPFYEQVYALYDDWLGQILKDAGPKAMICLVSDHGMSGVGKRFSPNTVLETAGLMNRTADGKGIDLTRTRICAPPWGDYLLTVNGTDWAQGIVSPTERDKTLQEAITALLAYRDPDSGKAVVHRVFRPEEVVGLGIGGEAGGDLYLDFAPGYVPTGRWEPSALLPYGSDIGGGVHGFFPLRKKMQAIFFLGGPDVLHDREIPGVRQIDIAPTLARILRIPAPADSVGHILGECFR